MREAASDGEPYDLGVAHDGDADRIVVLDPGGEVVHEDTVLAVLAEHYVRAGEVGETDAPGESEKADPVVVTTPNASARIDERVAAAGGRTERVRLGALHEGVAEHAPVAFAAEPWKHLHTAFGGWIDGVCSAAVLTRLVAAAGGLDALREPVSERPYRKVNVECPDGEKAAAMSRLRRGAAAAFPDATVDTEHGVRLDFADGSWALIRPSGTEPYLRVYVESEEIAELTERARGFAADAVRG
jgi:phosphomannomutase